MNPSRHFAVRPATPADAAWILRCLAAAFEPFRQQYTAEGFLDTVLTAESIYGRLRTMTLFVAVSDTVSDAGQIIGTIGGSVAAADTDEGHIRGMAVLPEWQGSGVAQALLDAVEADLKRHGCRRITLETTAPLVRAIAFYQRNGFRASGKVGDFFGMALYEYVKEL